METLPATRAARIVLVPEAVLPPERKAVIFAEPPSAERDYDCIHAIEPVGLLVDVYV